MTRVICYARQSIEREDGEHSLSLDSQITALTDRCQREGWAIVGVIRESGLKGFMDVDERPGLAEAITRAERGEYDRLLVWDLSRLARSLRLQEQWFWQFNRYGVEIVSHSEPESADILMRQIKGAFSEHRTREIASHVRRALRENTRRGVPHGSAPFGYQRGEGKVLTPNDDAATIERIFRLRAEGASLTDIALRLHHDGIPGPTGGPWHRTTLTEVLKNPVYTGTLCLAELQIPDTHPAIIDAELWQRAQHVASARPRWPRTKTARSWLEGLVVHACGAPMYFVGGSAGHPSMTFRCRVGGGWGHPDATCDIQPRQIDAARAEALAWQAVTERLTRLPRSPRATIARAQAHYRRLAPAADDAYRDATGRKSRAVARRERAIEIYLSGAIDRMRFDAESAAADRETAAAALDLANLPAPPDETALTAAWESLRDMRQIIATIAPARYGATLRALGVAVVSPAGVPLATGKRGPKPDAGMVTIRFRPELAVFLDQSR